MSTPEQEIAVLTKAELAELMTKLNTTGISEERIMYGNIITEITRKTLNLLLQAQAAAIAGNAPPSRESLRFMCPLTPF
jgi:hypothetical protein